MMLSGADARAGGPKTGGGGAVRERAGPRAAASVLSIPMPLPTAGPLPAFTSPSTYQRRHRLPHTRSDPGPSSSEPPAGTTLP